MKTPPGLAGFIFFPGGKSLAAPANIAVSYPDRSICMLFRSKSTITIQFSLVKMTH